MIKKIKNYSIGAWQDTDLTARYFFVLFLISCVIFKLLKLSFFIPIHYMHFTGAVYLMGILFAWPIKRSQVEKPLQIVLYAIFFLCVFYLFTAKTYISDADFEILSQSQPYTVFILKYGAIAAIALFVLSFFRPAMGLYLLLLFMFNKKANNEISGIDISPTDWIIVFEVAVLLVIMVMLDFTFKFLANLKVTTGRFRLSASLMRDQKTLHVYFLMAAIAVHFGNYFYSGVSKTGHFINLLDGVHFWTWTIENPTYVLINNAWYAGNLPIAMWPELTRHVFDIMKANATSANFIVITTQIICIFSLFKITWMKIITVFYDVLHLLIFITTGIFFWKWILLNAAIATALYSVKHHTIPRTVTLFCMGIVLLSPITFYIVKLAWLDTRANNIGYLQAIDKDGQKYRVPSNYFGALSVTFAQQRIGRPYDGFFKTGTFGNSYDYDVFIEANNCQDINLNSDKKALNSDEISLLSEFVLRHHRYIIDNVDERGRFSYDLYPHHIWTNPWLFQDFYALDKREIMRYEFVVEAACITEHSNSDKTYNADVKRKEVYDIPFNQY